MADNSMSGLSSDEAQAFHGLFMQGFIVFTVIAIIAHFLVWMWRPWFPGEEGYTSVINTVNSIIPFLA